ncbi:sporulation protein [Paenisporosarcina sp. OV554]|uniref:sporulation protein n=1 Tax=Paenisporosarcina sp. OV554 TaxID=2135694 RepID=UPI000D37177F|nr:sporulation protein [Paenisporosarcina sp. OV554]PUB10464.1 sporulation-control protein [Paenisporosarcina sp. OV554]
MILRKYMALLGVGSARIDLILEKDTYELGEQVKGVFVVKGGLIGQQLKRIECDLVMSDNENQKAGRVVDAITIYTTKYIESNAENHIPFTFRIPHSLHVDNLVSYRFKSRLAFNEGVESLDHDVITILKT